MAHVDKNQLSPHIHAEFFFFFFVICRTSNLRSSANTENYPARLYHQKRSWDYSSGITIRRKRDTRLDEATSSIIANAAVDIKYESLWKSKTPPCTPVPTHDKSEQTLLLIVFLLWLSLSLSLSLDVVTYYLSCLVVCYSLFYPFFFSFSRLLMDVG
jgi:hypothetical protein